MVAPQQVRRVRNPSSGAGIDGGAYGGRGGDLIFTLAGRRGETEIGPEAMKDPWFYLGQVIGVAILFALIYVAAAPVKLLPGRRNESNHIDPRRRSRVVRHIPCSCGRSSPSDKPGLGPRLSHGPSEILGNRFCSR